MYLFMKEKNIKLMRNADWTAVDAGSLNKDRTRSGGSDTASKLTNPDTQVRHHRD